MNVYEQILSLTYRPNGWHTLRCNTHQFLRCNTQQFTVGLGIQPGLDISEMTSGSQCSYIINAFGEQIHQNANGASTPCWGRAEQVQRGRTNCLEEAGPSVNDGAAYLILWMGRRHSTRCSWHAILQVLMWQIIETVGLVSRYEGYFDIVKTCMQHDPTIYPSRTSGQIFASKIIQVSPFSDWPSAQLIWPQDCSGSSKGRSDNMTGFQCLLNTFSNVT